MQPTAPCSCKAPICGVARAAKGLQELQGVGSVAKGMQELQRGCRSCKGMQELQGGAGAAKGMQELQGGAKGSKCCKSCKRDIAVFPLRRLLWLMGSECFHGGGAQLWECGGVNSALVLTAEGTKAPNGSAAPSADPKGRCAHPVLEGAEGSQLLRSSRPHSGTQLCAHSVPFQDPQPDISHYILCP